MDEVVSREVTVSNPQGVHARPSHAIVAAAGGYASQIELVLDERRADARSILSVMTLGAVQGATIRIEAKGEDAQAAADALAQLFESGFEED